MVFHTKEKQTVLMLLALTIAAFCLRWLFMPGNLFFGPEQGRDFLVIRDIVVNHKLTLIGSKTDIAGIFHGPVYYYMASLPFVLTHGNPVGVLAFFTMIQSLTVFLVYQLAVELVRSKRAGLLAAVLFASGFLYIVYSRWLLNPPLSIPLSLFFILFMLRYLRGNDWYLVAAGVAYGLLGQAEFINFLIFGAIGIATFIVYWKRFFKTRAVVYLSAAIAAFTVSFASYALFDFRHQFLITKAILGLLTGKSGIAVSLATSVYGAFHVLTEQIALVVGAWGWFVGTALVAVAGYAVYPATRKDKALWLLALWLFVPFLVFALLRHPMLEQLYAGVIVDVCIIFGIAIDWLWRKKAIIGIALLTLCVSLNAHAIFSNLPTNDMVFYEVQQPGALYSDQLSVIRWVYTKALGKPFSFQAYTIPYFMQDAWTYLFLSYGRERYGYVPDTKGRKLMYLVIQKDTLDPLFQKNWYKDTVERWGKKTAGTQIGDYRVEEWTL